jgi:HEAT repeat protein
MGIYEFIEGEPIDAPLPLLWAVAILSVLVLVCSVGLLVHHRFSEWKRSRRESTARRVLEILTPAMIGSDDLGRAAVNASRRYGRGIVAMVLRDARAELAGPEAERISLALDTIGEIQRLVRAASSRFQGRRLEAIRLLAECGGATAREVLRSVLTDDRWEVRRIARSGLVNMGDEAEIRAAIASYLTDPDREHGWKGSFFSHLAYIRPHTLIRLLDEEALDSASEKLALESLGDAGESEVSAYARARLASPEPELRASAARALGRIEEANAEPALVRLLDDPVWYVRAAAARGLENLPPSPDGIKKLSGCLGDSVWWVRSNAARTLANLGPSGLATLHEARGSNDRFARDMAAAALAVSELTYPARETASVPS